MKFQLHRVEETINFIPMLNKEKINEFQKIYKAHFGKELSFDEAYGKATALLQLMKYIYKPITKEEKQTYEK